MPTARHSKLQPADGIHTVVKWTYATIAARDAVTYAATDIGGVAQVGAAEPYTFHILTGTAPTWADLGGGLAKYGTGIDGAVTISVPTTLTRDMYYSSLTVNDDLRTAGYRVFVKGVCTIAATYAIHDNGNDAVTTTGGAGRAGSGGTTQALFAAGANGRTTAGNGNNGGNRTTSAGGSGGAGGDSDAHTGGTGGTATVQTAANGWPIHAAPFTSIGELEGTGNMRAAVGGAGGGAGAATPNAGTATSGGGGSGAGKVTLVARVIVNNGAISCNGGAGAAASVTGDGTAGGGAGGGGGFLNVTFGSLAGPGTITVTGGTAGAGAGAGGLAGVVGSVGTLNLLADV